MELYNKNNALSHYGLNCGYVQRKENKTMYKILYKEHNTYHVQSGKHNEIYNIWITFESNELTKARQFFNKIKIFTKV